DLDISSATFTGSTFSSGCKGIANSLQQGGVLDKPVGQDPHPITGPADHSHIQVTNIERVIFDKGASRFYDVSHQNSEHFIGLDGIVFVKFDLKQASMSGVHRRGVEFFGIHFAKAFESLDLNATVTELFDR